MVYNKHMMNSQEKKDFLAFRIRNIFINNRETPYTRQDFIDFFRFDKQTDVQNVLKSLLEEGVIKKSSGRPVLYSFNKIRTRNTSAFDSLYSQIDPHMTFGVEFEFGSHLYESDIREALEEAGFDCFSDKTRFSPGIAPFSKWTVTSDSSISVLGYEHDVEVISPILKGEEGLREIKRMTDFLNQLKRMKLIKQNNTCGTHVHHSAKKFCAITKLIRFAEKAQPAMNEYVHKSRALSDDKISLLDMDAYCAPIKKEKYLVGRKLKKFHEKYLNLNISKYAGCGTVEFRQLHGSTDFRTIAQWIVLNQRIIRHSFRYREAMSFDNMNQLKSFLEVA